MSHATANKKGTIIKLRFRFGILHVEQQFHKNGNNS